ncbi:MAG: hypothetical protein M0R37_12230 [Bacteroidales bacterium]|jgi:hypothetical protein|nr:hypothetical protein [Bacteroidales bacterium]
MFGLDDQFTVTVPISEDGATTYMTSGYFKTIALPIGALYEVSAFAVSAATDCAAQDTNYMTVTLTDASGNSIAAVANGTSTTGTDFDVNPATGADSTLTAAYKRIDCSAAASYLKIVTTGTGAGRVCPGLQAHVTIKRLRNPS